MKTVMAGTMGFGLGGVFGLFMASVCLPPLFPNTLLKLNTDIRVLVYI